MRTYAPIIAALCTGVAIVFLLAHFGIHGFWVNVASSAGGILVYVALKPAAAQDR